MVQAIGFMVAGAAAITLALVGCQSREPVKLSATVNEAEVSAYTASGTGRIWGQAFLRQAGGAVVTCAGEEAALVPAVALIDEAMTVWAAGEDIDPTGIERREITGAIRWSRCDAQGNFEFARLPAQPFWLMAAVRWRAGKDETQGGMLARRIVVYRTSEERIILSQHDVDYLKAKPWEIWDASR